MTDLYLAISASAAATAIVFAACVWLLRPVHRSAALLLLLGTVALLTFYLQHGVDHIIVARLLPVSSAIILGNLTPILTAIAGALAWRAIEGALIRRILVAAVIVITGCIASWHVAWPDVPALRNQRIGPIWRQTTEASCSAAAAATLLEAHGIAATEAEMGRLSLTSHKGTRTLGVFRGLILKTRGTRFRVEPFSGSHEQLRAIATSPVLINVALRPEDVPGNERFVTDWGWIPGMEHTVVLFGTAPNGLLIVGDPATGLEHWTPEALDVLWHGEAFRLVER